PMIWRYLAIGLALAACSVKTSSPGAPPTIEDRCRTPCTPTKGHPCGSPDASACISDCVARVEGVSDVCRDCILSYSGWRGATCSCDDAFGSLGSLTCTECGWAGNTQGCNTNFSSCGAAKTCDGYEIMALDDRTCAAKCGLTPDAADEGG